MDRPESAVDEFLEEAPEYRGEWTCHLVRRLSARGFTETDVADVMSIALETFEGWKSEHDELAEALRQGRQEANGAVERALIQLAIGFEYQEEVLIRSGKKVAFTRYQPPSTNAIKSWLEHNMPEVYGRK
jgi:hypothetical protein